MERQNSFPEYQQKLTPTPEKQASKETFDKSSLPKKDILSQCEEYATFKMLLEKNVLPDDLVNELYVILEKINPDELQDYLNMELFWVWMVDLKSVRQFTERFKKLASNLEEKTPNILVSRSKVTENLKKDEKSQAQEEKDSFKELIKDSEIKDAMASQKVQAEIAEKRSEAVKVLHEQMESYRKAFGKNRAFLTVLEQLDRDLMDPVKVKKDIGIIQEMLSQAHTRKSIFDELAKTWDSALYHSTYQALAGLSPEIEFQLADIPKDLYSPEVIQPWKIENEAIMTQFPQAQTWDVVRRGDLVYCEDKVVDTKTNQWYIEEHGYRLPTSVNYRETLQERAKFERDRRGIVEELSTHDTLLGLLERRNTLESSLQVLQAQKSMPWLHAQDLMIDIEIRQAKREQVLIDKKIKNAFSSYSPLDSKNFTLYLQESKSKLQTQLHDLQQKSLSRLSEVQFHNTQDLQARDDKARDTLDFLEMLGLTNIPQWDLQRLIDAVNLYPNTYGLVAPISLEKWFREDLGNPLAGKKEFFHNFMKLYDAMGFDPPVSERILTGFVVDTRLQNDFLISQRLEMSWFMRNGELQYHKVMETISGGNKHAVVR